MPPSDSMQNFNKICDSYTPTNSIGLNSFFFTLLFGLTKYLGFHLLLRFWIQNHLKHNCLISRTPLFITGDLDLTGRCKSSIARMILEEHGYTIATPKAQAQDLSPAIINCSQISARTTRELRDKCIELAISVAEQEHKC